MKPKTPAEIEAMRYAGRGLAEILRELASQTVAGVSGQDIAAVAKEAMLARDFKPILLGYQGFPDVICISLNDEVVHGIPHAKPFVDGDLVKLDLSLAYKGMVVDAALTVFVGGQAENAQIKNLLAGTQAALAAGIDAIHGSGTRIGDISAAIQNVLDKHHLGVVRDLVGHGVGYGLHEGLEVPNYGSRGTGPVLPAGATIAIEPMATVGDWQVVTKKDGWTVATRDHSLSAHFEHTVLVTETGAEILTQV